ncbi:polysaccharide pyruvyl transferase family protein [Brevundimonas sp.]|uniref:polysaccharide pyruvyl transferase family protein n=1 Tax=Brevundimonas sp. TaxID=1871086 RepID=UPI0035B30ABF
MTTCAEVIARQRDQLLRQLGRELAPGQRYALVDHPDHDNIGDSAIWAGAVRLLRTLSGRPPSYASGLHNHDAADLKRAVPEGPIFITGGGSFGDLYPEFHAFKLSILRDFPGRRIVQLPQSLHFRDPDAIARTAAAIRAHGDFRLMVRDHQSLAFAQSNFDCEVSLAPDAAFGLGPLQRAAAPSIPVLQFRRRDQESAADPVQGAVDWPAEDSEAMQALRWPSRLDSLAAGVWGRNARQVLGLNRLADHRLARGVALLSQAEAVVCDRLHVHILCMLLGLPHVFLDNSTGKIGAYHAAWTSDCALGRPAADGAEALRLLERTGRPHDA